MYVIVIFFPLANSILYSSAMRARLSQKLSPSIKLRQISSTDFFFFAFSMFIYESRVNMWSFFCFSGRHPI